MPIIKSAKKQLRQNKTKKARNDFFKTAYRDARKAFELAIKNSDKKAAAEVYFNTKDKDGKNIKSGLQSVIDKLVKKNIIHKNNGSRKKAKFARALKAIS